MRVIIFHLSDIHIEKKDDTNVKNVQKIVNVLNTESNYGQVMVLISGDIAFSGKQEQYKYAFKMIMRIKEGLEKISHGKPVVVYLVPGNHDIDFSVDVEEVDTQKVIENGSADYCIENEIKKQRGFVNFSNGLHCFSLTDNLVAVKKNNWGTMDCNVYLLNTALFSKRVNDKGLHYLPMKEIAKINFSPNSEYSIAIMHHSEHWFHECVKSELENALMKTCQLIFYGHEHNMGTRIVEKDGNNALFLAGGELCNKGDWGNSEFYFDVLDTEKRTIEVNQYQWNQRKEIYERKKKEQYDLNSKSGCEFRYDEEFERNLYKDDVNSISDNLFDYYVFPSIEIIKTNSTVEREVFHNRADFVQEIVGRKRITIFGGDNAGKTTLVRDLFLAINGEGRTCLLCDVSQLNSINLKYILQTIFRQNYKDHDGEFDAFLQLPRSQRAILIDGIESVDKHSSKLLLDYLDEYFDIIIYTTKEIVELDPTERLMQAAEMATYYQYKLLPFYKDKRVELIHKVIDVKYNESEVENRRTAQKIEETLESLRKMYSMNPAFIIQFVEYCCKNYKDGFATDGNVFSKVFESNITLAIRPFAKGMTVDKVLVILDEIAYWSYKNKVNAIDQNEIYDIIHRYNEVQDDCVDYANFIEICQKSKILRGIADGKYRFIDKNRLAYFIARQIIRLWNDNLDDSDLKELIRYIKYGINSNIIMFITYLTDNLYLMRRIVDDTISYTENWTKFDVVNINVPYLNEINGMIEVDAPTEKDKRESEKREKAIEEKEINEYENNQVEIKDYFDYSTDDSEVALNQIMRSLSLLDIVAKCLPGFEHRMNKEDKQKILSLIYDMPSKIFYMWAMQVEEERDEILSFFLSEYRSIYLEPKDWDLVRKEDMLRYLQMESIHLLLDIMRLAVNNAAKEHTYQYFSKYESKTVIEQLEYLQVLTKMDQVDEVAAIVQALDKAELKTIPRYMWKRILKRYLVYSDKISTIKMQQLESKYFPVNKSNSEHKKLLISRERRKRRK